MYQVGGSIPGVAADNPGLKRLIQGLVFPVGLLLVIINGAELFTGNCTVGTNHCQVGHPLLVVSAEISQSNDITNA